MPSKKPPQKWTGDLARAIRWTGPQYPEPMARGLLHSEPSEEDWRRHREALDQATADARTEKIRRLLLLKEHYGIKTDNASEWPLLLCLALAEDFVRPGFRIETALSRRGRTREWNLIRYAELVADVEAVKRRQGRGDRDACRFLAKDRQFQARWGVPDHTTIWKWVRTLETSLSRARKEPLLRAMARNAADVDHRQFLIDSLVQNFSMDKVAAQQAGERVVALLAKLHGERKKFHEN